MSMRFRQFCEHFFLLIIIPTELGNASGFSSLLPDMLIFVNSHRQKVFTRVFAHEYAENAICTL
jgi:hypothetical protein